MHDRPPPTLPPGARLDWCVPCNTRRVRLGTGRCLACGHTPNEVRDYTVTRSVEAHGCASEKHAAIQYFEATGERPGQFGTLVLVDGRNVVVYPHEVDEAVGGPVLPVMRPRMGAQQYAERGVR